MNLLMNIGLTDIENGDGSKVLRFLQKTAESLDVKSRDYMPYIQQYGINRLVEDKIGRVFSRNKYSCSIISDSAISEDGHTLWVMCEAIEDDGFW